MARANVVSETARAPNLTKPHPCGPFSDEVAA